MKKISKLIILIIIVLFLSLYISNYINNYYDNKNVLTEESIERFEKDLKEGKEINPKDYLKEEKNYNNRFTKLGRKTSNLIENTFNKLLRSSMRYLEKIENS